MNISLGIGIIKSDRVFEAMNSTDRAKYTQHSFAYIDAPQGIGYGATISAPHMVLLHVQFCIKILTFLKIFLTIFNITCKSLN